MVKKNKLTIMLTQGLGNQMFEYAAAKYYGKKFKKRLVLHTGLILGGSSPSQGFYTLKHFKLCENKLVKILPFNKFLYRFYVLYYRLFIMRDSTTFTDIDGYRKNSINNKTKVLNSCFVNAKYATAIRHELLQDFVPNKSLSETAGKYLSDIQSQDCSISIHVRRGDYVRLKGYKNYSIEYYKSALSLLKKKHATGTIYIFSDDIEWCEENMSDLGSVFFVKGTQNAFEDMWLMSKCVHNIIPNSTFSWWGAFLNTNPDKIVVMPQKWNDFGDSADTLKFDGCLVYEEKK